MFVDNGCAQQPFNDGDAISSRLQQLLFLFPGSVRQQHISKLKFMPLVMTGDTTGTVTYSDILLPALFGMGGGQLNPAQRHRRTSESYVLAAHITGKPGPAAPANPHQLGATNLPMADEGSPAKEANSAEAAQPGTEPATGDAQPAQAKPADRTEADSAAADNKASEATAEQKPANQTAEPPREAELNVVLVGDIDVLYSAFVALRNRGDDPEAEVKLDVRQRHLRAQFA